MERVAEPHEVIAVTEYGPGPVAVIVSVTSPVLQE